MWRYMGPFAPYMGSLGRPWLSGALRAMVGNSTPAHTGAIPMNGKKVLIPIAHGSESLETVTIANILRRGNIGVTLASIEPELQVYATLDIRLLADRALKEVLQEPFDLIAL